MASPMMMPHRRQRWRSAPAIVLGAQRLF